MTRKRYRVVAALLLSASMMLFMGLPGCQSSGSTGSFKTASTVSGNPGSGDLGQKAIVSLNVNIVDSTGAPVNGFRWLLEEDTSIHVTPGALVSDSLSVNIHRSYAPVVASGESATDSASIPIDDSTYYMLSVLPTTDGYTLGGSTIVPGQTSVTIQVHEPPIPTAQISVFVFEDNALINGAPDIPAEVGLPGFEVIIQDIAGHQMMDVFGNMLGTTYQTNPDGTYVMVDGAPVVDTPGTGIVTDADGNAIIRNIAPGNYTVTAIPAAGGNWIQTSTVEGTAFTDAWVKAGEPPYLSEWGVPSVHVFIGFVQPMLFPAPTGPVSTITGQVVYSHDNRPPLSPGVNPGTPVPTAWVGLNDLLGTDNQVYTGPCDANGFFTIENVPPGTYNMATWDQALDAIIDFRTVVVPPAGGPIDLGQVPLFAWYGTLEGYVFTDSNGNGIMDAGEMGIQGQAVNYRYPDGSIRNAGATDPNGFYQFLEIFPFFHWMIAEVDYARLKPTGAYIQVDDGGALAPGEKLNPQLQPENSNLPWRTDLGAEVLLEAMLLYAGQAAIIDWGKVPYGPGENGGISGMVIYDTTRAEYDPAYATQEDWEPGIPRVQVNLYDDANFDGVIDDWDGDNLPTLADVDNWPFGWQDGGAIGPEDVDRNLNGTFDPGDAINIVHTDSFDDSNPTGCVGPAQSVHGQPVMDCAETIATWNQTRPGVFDGGYIFLSYFPNGMVSGSLETEGIPPGYYIVEAPPPPGYETYKEEDVNVFFGEQYIPNALLPSLGPPASVGDSRVVPADSSLFPGSPSPYAGMPRNLPDRKLVLLSDGLNAAVNFYMFTPVPKAAKVWGMVFNDIALEYDPNSPNMGNNLGVSWLPIAIKDFMGNTVSRIYTDEWGRYNTMLPSTYTVNVPAPSGVSPNALDICLNDPGPIEDPLNPGTYIIDPWYNPSYGQICGALQFLPSWTTVADTPILPIGAFTQNKVPLNCELPDGTPVIAQVDSAAGGPFVATTPGQITITSLGTATVYNPDFDPSNPLSPQTISRDYGFSGTPGSVTVGGVPLSNVVWGNATITGDVPVGASTGELVVTRGDNGVSSVLGITVHVGGSATHVSAGQSIQAAIDAAADNALIIVGPGTFKENLIMWHPVKLQGSGAYATFIQGSPMTQAEMNAWDAKVAALITAGTIETIDTLANNEQGGNYAGVLVNFNSSTVTSPANRPLIDGFQINMAIYGGAIYANAWASNLEISNNKLQGNQGTFGGAIRIGTPSVANAGNTGYLSSNNPGIIIHNNHIAQNGSINGGGGFGIFNGSDGYAITNNFICGNYTLAYGGGIAHFGLSDNCSISHNTIILNQSTDEGGGIIVAGELVAGGAPAGTLTEGSGSVVIDTNYIIGNLGGDDGGGIRTLMTNGQDVQNNPATPSAWYEIDILNNIIADNSSADAGGGIALDDSANVAIVNNTIAHNDSTATSPDSFATQCTVGNPPGQFCPNGQNPGGGLITSTPQVAGINAGTHSAGLRGAFDVSVYQEYANPILTDNIIYQNRSFYWDAAYNAGVGGLRPDIGGGELPVYWDLGVSPNLSVQFLNPMNCVLTRLTEPLEGGGTHNYDASNTDADPLFVDGTYFNDYLATSKGAAFGNFVMATFFLPSNHGDYHIGLGSSAIDFGGGVYYPAFTQLANDIDGDTRPLGGVVDSGADELQ